MRTPSCVGSISRTPALRGTLGGRIGGTRGLVAGLLLGLFAALAAQAADHPLEIIQTDDTTVKTVKHRALGTATP